MPCYYSKFLTTTILVSVSLVSVAQNRVDDDLVSLYTFHEGEGAYINDVSGFGTPLTLRIEDMDHVSWVNGGGVQINEATIIKSFSSAAKISDAIASQSELTMEAWIIPDNTSQDGPARIATVSWGSGDRNMTLAQDGPDYTSRIRTDLTSDNGLPQSAAVGVVQTVLQHVVYTLDNTGVERFFVNGAEVYSGTRDGDLNTWDADFPLALANEVGADRSWLGTLHLVAFYSRALAEEDVVQNYNAGHVHDGPAVSAELCEEEFCFVQGYGADQRVLWFADFPNIHHRFEFDENGGHLDLFEDGTAHLYGQTINMEEPEYGLFMDVWFKDRADWDAWSGLGRSWKGDPEIVGDNYLNWDYYIMDPDIDNQLIGTGELEGSLLHLTHHPITYYYGFQVGLGANALNGEPGMSCWFDYEGELFGEWVEGNGDVNMEGECLDQPVLQCVADAEINCDDSTEPEFTGFAYTSCPDEYTLTFEDNYISSECPIVIERTWIATNEGGDQVTCVQMITASDTEAPLLEAQIIQIECGESIAPAVVDNCDPSPTIEITVLDSSWMDNEDCDDLLLRTQTPGGWGAPPNGNNPGQYLHAHFTDVFPTGLEIGCNNTLRLTSAQAITDFLPSGGTPAVLPSGQLTDPGQQYSNTLASHCVALTLSCEFDQHDPDFGFDDLLLSDAIVQSGEFLGWTVSDILLEANQLIGGCESQFSPSQVVDVLSSINENYVDGTTNEGFLGCSLPWDCYLAIGLEITATDACGNQSVLTTTAYVVDETEPQVENFEEQITVPCGQIPDPEIEIVDECFEDLTVVEVSDVEFSGNCFPTIQRTYTITDACGNQAEYIQFIIVVDMMAPVILTEPENAVISCGEAYPEFTPEVIDNCDESPQVVYSEEVLELNCGALVTRTWTVTDLCGNSVVTTQELTVIDDVPPQPSSFETELEVNCDNIPGTEVTFVDLCSEVGAVDFQEQQIGDGCNYDIIRTWTASDACGNTAVAVQILHVTDNQSPIVTYVPPSQSILCGMPIPAEDATAIDMCGEVSTFYSETSGGEEGCPQVVRRWDFTDECGNLTTAEQVVTIIDNIAPTLSESPADIIGTCSDWSEAPEVIALDNCDDVITVSFNEETVGSSCGVLITRTWSATDQCGNETSHVQTLNLTDEEPPVINGSQEVTTDCATAFSLDLIEAIDDCQMALVISFEDEVIGAGCNYDIVRLWTVTDPCGNAANFEQLIHVVDASAPEFGSVPEDVALSCGEAVPQDQPEVMDSCSDFELAYEEIWDDSGCTPLVQRIWTAVDDCGNSAQAIQIVTFEDTEGPQLNGIPEDVLISCADDLPGVPVVTASDNCDNNPSITYTETLIQGACENSYSIERTWTATDACGNIGSATQVIDVIDNTAPVFDDFLEDLEVPCGEIPEPAVVNATDDCGGDISVALEEITDSGGCPNITRIWTATDACGNSAVMTQLITVVDTEPPLLEGIPGDMEVTCNTIPDMPDPEVSDNCDDNVAVTMNESVIGSGCEFIIMRTWIASDDCGNTTIHSQSITVTDEEPPVFVDAPEEMTVECSELDALPYPTIMDDCGNTVNISYVDVPQGSGCNYDIERTYTATDLCGHQAQATMIIHVVDLTPPQLTGVPPNQYVDCSEIPETPVVTATDACSSVAEINYSETQIGEGCDYIISRSWTASDACGNQASMVSLVYVSDETAPILSGVPEDLVLDCDGEIPPPASPTATDNCDEDLLINFIEFTESDDCADVVTRIWTVTDDCGNTQTATQTVTVTDLTPPDIGNIPADVEVSCDAIPEPGSVATFDACSPDITVSVEDLVVTGSCPYIIERTWTAVDGCGNVSTATQIISVLDEIAPLLSEYPADLTLGCGELPEVPVITASDNCQDNILVEFSETSLPGQCVSVVTRVWTATDFCGNTAEHVQHIYLHDEEAPYFTVVPVDGTVECDTYQPITPIEVMDDCGEVQMSMQEIIEETNCENEFLSIRIWTATDACGNVTQHVQELSVVDSTPPQIISVPIDAVVGCGEVPPVPEIEVVDNCDNDVQVDFDEEIITLSADDDGCQLGNAVSLAGEVAVWLPDLGGYGSNYVFGEAGVFTQDLNAGTAHLHGQVYNVENANQGWIMEIELHDAQGWEEWSANGGSYKDDMNIAGDNYLDWIFFKMLSGTLTGTGEFEGSTLELSHAPANFTFGFQMGLAANNRNAEFGMSGWFFYSGTLNGEEVAGVGDVLVEMDCCPEEQIIRTWVLTDCGGNTSVYTQNIFVVDGFDFNPLVYPDYRTLDLNVNLTGEHTFQIDLFSGNSGYVTVELFSASGNLVDKVFEGFLVQNMAKRINYTNDDLSAAFHIFRVSQAGETDAEVEVSVH